MIQRVNIGASDAPAGHRPGLRRTVGNDRALAHAGERRERHEFAVVEQARVDFVGEDPHLRMQPQDVGDRLEIGALQAASGRIVRGVEDQQPRLLRDLGLELVRVESEVTHFAQVNRYRHRAVGNDLRLVNREPGDRIDHLITGAMIGDRRDGIRDERLGAGANDDFVGRDVESPA